jgi:hypothetical protein
MKWIGRSGQSPAMAVKGAESVKASIKPAKGNFIIEYHSFIRGRLRISYRDLLRSALQFGARPSDEASTNARAAISWRILAQFDVNSLNRDLMALLPARA